MLTPTELMTRFPSLAGSLAPTTPTPLLGLYFAAAWCPDCTGVTPVLDKVFTQQKPPKVFDLIYVSSDKDEAQLQGNLPSPSWGFVPFDHEQERSNLKRYFGACAAKEVALLDMKAEDRLSGIPTLILVDKKTGNIVTRDGVDDIMANNDDNGGAQAAVAKWKGLLETN